jgi:hypothetical protein
MTVVGASELCEEKERLGESVLDGSLDMSDG